MHARRLQVQLTGITTRGETHVFTSLPSVPCPDAYRRQFLEQQPYSMLGMNVSHGKKASELLRWPPIILRILFGLTASAGPGQASTLGH